MIYRNFILFMLLVGIFMPGCQSKEHYKHHNRNLATRKLFKQAKKHFRSEYDLDLIGPLAHYSDGLIEGLDLVLEQESDPSINEAKAMLVGVTRYFYDLVKSDENLTQYLARPPFQSSDLGVLIVFEHKNLPQYSSPFVVSISLYGEKASICFFNSLEDLQPEKELWFSYAELEREFGKQSYTNGDTYEYTD